MKEMTHCATCCFVHLVTAAVHSRLPRCCTSHKPKAASPARLAVESTLSRFVTMKKSSDPLVAGLAGAVGGGVEASFTWPTELAKTHLQLQASGKVTGHPHYNGILDCWKQTVRRSGVGGLYRGLTPILIMSFPKAGVRFAGFSMYRPFFADKDGKMSGWRNFACGLCAGATEAVLVVTPQETLKVKLIDGNAGFLKGTANILRTEGIRGIYQGLVPTIGKQASNQGIRFLTFTEYVPHVSALRWWSQRV